MPARPRSSVLLLRPGAIGDSLLTAPALAALRAARPATRLILVAHPAVRELFLAGGLVDEFHSRDSPQADALFAATPELALSRLGRVDAAVAWTGEPDGCVAANLRALGAEPVVLRPSRPPEASGTHVAAHLLSSLEELGVSGRLEADRPYLAGAAVGRGVRGAPRHGDVTARTGPRSAPLRERVVVHPGSGSGRKNWAAEHFGRVAEALWRERGAQVTVLGGPADEEALRAFGQAVECPHEILRNQPLEVIAAGLADCDLYLGNDSGVSHLAGLVGAPTIALFGPTDSAQWRPLGPSVRVLRHQPLAELEPDAVLAVAFQTLAAGRWRSE